MQHNQPYMSCLRVEYSVRWHFECPCHQIEWTLCAFHADAHIGAYGHCHRFDGSNLLNVFLVAFTLTKRLYIGHRQHRIMDAHELFIRYQENDFAPKPNIIFDIFVNGKVRTLELIALIYASKGQKIPMDKVYAYGHEQCMKMADTMLTPLVVKYSTFKEVEASAQKVLAAFSTVELSPSSAPTRPSSAVSSRTITPSYGSGESKHSDLHDALTEERPPLPTLLNTPKKLVRNFVSECDNYFFYKSKTRIKSMTAILKSRVGMSWVRGVASKLETDEDYSRSKYLMFTGTSRHIHRTGRSVCQFIQALADESVKTFSWSLQDSEAIHLPKCRTRLQSYCSKTAPEQHITLCVLLCSIGLPTFQLYTPCSFLKKWRRFKNVSSDNVVKALLQDSQQSLSSQQLLDEYSPGQIDVVGDPGTVELYMFKYFYSYPTKPILGRLVEYANANLEHCLGI